MDITVRAVCKDDADDIAEIFSHQSVLRQTSQLPYRSKKYWRRFYDNDGIDGLVIVAQVQSKAVGHLGLFTHESPRRRHAAGFGLVVHPDYQGRGVGKALLTELISVADGWLNLLKIELSVYADNETAIGLYRRFGFVAEGLSRFDAIRDGEYIDTLRMARYNPQRVAAGSVAEWRPETVATQD